MPLRRAKHETSTEHEVRTLKMMKIIFLALMTQIIGRLPLRFLDFYLFLCEIFSRPFSLNRFKQAKCYFSSFINETAFFLYFFFGFS